MPNKKTKKTKKKNIKSLPSCVIDTYIDPKKSVEIIRHQSQLQSIVVEDYAEHRFLHTGTTAIQSAMSKEHPQQLVLQAIQYLMGIVLFLCSKPERFLIAGVGGGSLIRFVRHYYPACGIECVDIDGSMFEIAKDYFGLPKVDANTQYIVQDAFAFIKVTRPNSYDALIFNIDYGEALPKQFTTQKFYKQCRLALVDSGILVLNFIVDEAEDLREVLTVLRLVFKRRCLCFEVPEHYNVIIYAFKEQPKPVLSFKQMKQRAEDLQLVFDLDTPAIWKAVRTAAPSIAKSGKKSKISDIIP